MPVMQKVYETFELLPMLLVGIVGGLLGSLFNFLNEKLTVWRKQNVTHSRQKLWDVAAVAVLSATLSFLLPLTVPCRVCPTSSQQFHSLRLCSCSLPKVLFEFRSANIV